MTTMHKEDRDRRWFRAGMRLLIAVAFLCATPRVPSAQSVPPAGGEKMAAADLLRPGDVIRLRIWREPDLSGEFLVDENGVVVFPKLGPYTVTNDSPEALKARLIAAYQRYLRNPSIDVVLLRRVTILGEVRSPGAYQVDPTMTLADAIALAGGSTSRGNANDIELYRNGVRLETRFDQRTRIGDTPIQSGDYIYVPERSWLRRNSGVATMISTGVSLFIAIFIK